MEEPLKLLLIEDSDDDVQLVLRTLRRAGFQTSFDRVQTADEMRVALALQVWDVIIADFQLPVSAPRPPSACSRRAGATFPLSWSRA